jgi:hypothetical protein
MGEYGMLVDILIATGIAIIQLLISIYAVVVAVEKRRVHIACIIGLFGVIGIGLTVWGTVRTEVNEQKLEKDLADLKTGQRTTNSGIEDIKKNPPIVKPVPPTATVSLMKQEGSYHTVTSGQVAPDASMYAIGKPVSLNLFFHNVGAAADHMKGYVKLYLTNDTEKNLTDKFKQAAATAFKSSKGTSLPSGGEQSMWFTAKSDAVFTEEDKQKLADGSEHLYVFSSVEFSDAAGKHFVHMCEILQQPQENQPPIWQFCEDFSDHR